MEITLNIHQSISQATSNIFCEFDAHVTMHRDKFLIINQLDAPISQIYFWNETLRVSESSSVHHQECFTVHTADSYDIYHCCVYSEKLLMMGRGTVRNL